MGTARPIPARYLTRLLTTTTGARLVAWRLFPDAKEVTESFGIRQAITRVPDLDPRDCEVVLVSVGDGTTPRTAATFAVTTAWQCHAVDPRLRPAGPWATIPRLTCHRSRAEEVRIEGDTVVVTMVHAHVDVATAVTGIDARRLFVVAMPCCVPPGITERPLVRYRDADVGSPANEISIWVDP